jgi:hypothetical protein
MPTWYWIAIFCVFGLPVLYKFVLIWVMVPIKVHSKQTLAQRPNLQYATAEHITPELSEMLQSILPPFRAEGFESAAMTRNANSVPGVQSVVATLVNRSTHDVAVIISTWAKNSRSLVYAIRSEFTDDSIVSTGVNPGIGVYPRDPKEDSAGFSQRVNIHALCEFHRRRLRHLGVDQLPRHPVPPGAELERIFREWDRTTSRLIRLRYMYLDHSAQLFRYTWKGAFLCTWRLIHPIKGWRIKRRDRRALDLWRKLQMPGEPADTAMRMPHVAATPADPPPTTLDSDSSALNYEVSLNEGEVFAEQTASGLTLRVGTATVGQYLARSWFTLLWLLFCAGLITLILVTHGLMRTILPRAGTARGLSTSFFVLLLFALWDFIRILRAVICLRGTIVLTATRQGLTYRNIPALKGSGHIARHDLRGLLVAARYTGFRKLHILCALRENARPLHLFAIRDPQKAQQARAALARALGIESPEPATVT